MERKRSSIQDHQNSKKSRLSKENVELSGRVSSDLQIIANSETSLANDLASDLLMPNSSTRKAPGKIDIPNTNLLKPFEYGWVRELVYRRTNVNNVKRSADVYYYTPTGIKVRSSRELQKYLNRNLSLDNFSFYKEPIGINDPTKEIIREAKSSLKLKAVEDGEQAVGSLKEKVPKVKIEPESKNFVKKRNSPDLFDNTHNPESNNGQTNDFKKDPVSDNSPPKKKCKLVSKENSINISNKNETQSIMINLNGGITGLLRAFQYLNPYELLQARCVSKLWGFIGSHPSCWRTIRLKNLRVSDWKGFARALSKHNTDYLNVEKMHIPKTLEEQEKMWEELCVAVKSIKSLTKLNLGFCSLKIFCKICNAAPQVEFIVSKLNPIFTNEKEIAKGYTILFRPLDKLDIKTQSEDVEIKDLICLKDLKTLRISSSNNLQGIEDYLPKGLINLELGNCTNFSLHLATVALPRLKYLKRLRLEKGQECCPTSAILATIATLPNLKVLELIDFDIKPGFDKKLAKCTNLEGLLIIPTFIGHEISSNLIVLNGVRQLKRNLKYFLWCFQSENLFIPSNVKTVEEAVGYRHLLGERMKRLIELRKQLDVLLPTTETKLMNVLYPATHKIKLYDYFPTFDL